MEKESPSSPTNECLVAHPSLCVGYVRPEAAIAGAIGLLRNGDVIGIAARPDARSLRVEVSDAGFAERRTTQPVENRCGRATYSRIMLRPWGWPISERCRVAE
jgi:dihydroxyacid dehydratase/phosphogluconate dehydratase